MNTMESALHALLDDFQKKYQLPGYDLAIWHHGKPIYRRMEGYASLEDRILITDTTLYNLYSNTKVITCVAALQLYEKGLFQLDDPIRLYFPEFSKMKVRTTEGSITDAKTSITIRDLFRMTAGIGDGDDYTDMGMTFYMETQGACPVIELPRFLARVPLLFEPATQYKYGICHEVLAALIEQLSGQKFSDYLKEHIFDPLDMQNTAFSLDRLSNKALAVQYRFCGENQPLENLGAANCLIPPILKESASGGLISTVDDYMKFQQALCSGETLLKRNTIELMRHNQLQGSQFEGYGYTNLGLGYGLGVRTGTNLSAPGPFGWGGASGSYGSIDPEHEICIFYMQHTFGTNDPELHNQIRDLVYSHLTL